MPLQHFTRVVSIDDMKVSKLLTEPGTGVGAATYAASIDLVGATMLKFAPKYTSLTLRGDNAVLETDVIPDVTEGQFDYGKINQDALTMIWGGTQADAGVTPNQTSTFTLTGGQLPVYFKIEAQCKTTDYPTGDVHFVLYKCKVVSGPEMTFSDAAYGLQVVTFRAVQPKSTDPIFRIVANETLVTIP